MNFLGNSLTYLSGDRVNQWPDRRDRAQKRRPLKGNGKVCRPDRFVPNPVCREISAPSRAKLFFVSGK